MYMKILYVQVLMHYQKIRISIKFKQANATRNSFTQGGESRKDNKNVCAKVFKNGRSKICGRDPLKNLK